MKQLNITYEDKEFEIIEKAKKKADSNWHNLILSWAKNYLGENDGNTG